MSQAKRVLIPETPRGEITLPRAVFDQIKPDLPSCFSEGKNDAPPGAQYAPLLLRRESRDDVTLMTRNAGLIEDLVAAGGHNVRRVQEFNFESCHHPSSSGDLLASTTLLPPTNGSHDELEQKTTQLVDFLREYRCGQICSLREADKYDDIARVCAAFPEAPVVLVVASNADVDRVAEELAKRLRETIHRAYGLDARPQCRITVTNYTAFRGEDLRDAPLVICPVWYPGFPAWMRTLLWNPNRDRIYFFRSFCDRVSAEDKDGLLGRLGPEFSYSATTSRGASVYSIFDFGGLRNACGCTPAAANRVSLDKPYRYWFHDHRNRALAGLACQLAREPASLAMLVETPEHAHQLQRWLPESPLVYGKTEHPELPHRCIVTLTAAAVACAFRPERLIIAMGGPPSDWLTNWMKQQSGAGRAVQLYDLSDGFAAQTAALAQARQAAYRDANCHWRPLPNEIVQAVGNELRWRQTTARRAATT